MSLYEMVRKAKRNDTESMEEVLKKLEPKISHTVHSIEKRYQEDVEQEVKLRVMEAVRQYEIKEFPTFDQLLRKTEDGRAILNGMKNDNSKTLHAKGWQGQEDDL